jgi:cysteine-rich repeat protein
MVNVTAGEQCDPADPDPAAPPCNPDCTLSVCGDGIVNPAAGEQCDDGGETATCDADCTIAYCGDGTANTAAGEACDDGGESATCNADCTSSRCGDGVVNRAAGEECDDGNDVTTDGCPSGQPGLCKFATCGDGFHYQGVEVCDDTSNGGQDSGCDTLKPHCKSDCTTCCADPGSC